MASRFSRYRLYAFVGWAIVAVGLLHMAPTFRLATPSANARVWFFGAGIAIVLVGALNVLHRAYGRSAAGLRLVCRSANLLLAIFATVAGVITGASIAQQVLLLCMVGSAFILSCLSLKDSFDAAIIDAAQGGTMATAAKNAQRELVINALNKNASYVDITVGGNLEAILSSGYETVSTNRAQSLLEPPQIVAVERPQTGQLRVRIKGDPTMKSVVGRIKQVGGSEFGPSITFQNSKKILFKGLTGGMNYIIQLCGIGGSNGQSDWTESGPNIAL